MANSRLFKVEIKDETGVIKFNYSIPYLLLPFFKRVQVIAGQRASPGFAFIDPPIQAQATTLFILSLAQALAHKKITLANFKCVICKYLNQPFLVTSTLNPKQIQLLTSYSFVFISETFGGYVINYNIYLNDSYNNNYSTANATYNQPFLAPGFCRNYTGSIYIEDTKVIINQSLQISNDPNYGSTASNPGNVNYCLGNKCGETIEKTTISIEDVKATITFIQQQMSYLTIYKDNIKDLRRMIQRQTKDWSAKGQWILFPKIGKYYQYLVGFNGTIGTTSGCYPLRFTIKMIFGTPIIESNLALLGYPLYLNPLTVIQVLPSVGGTVVGTTALATLNSFQLISGSPIYPVINPSSTKSRSLSKSLSRGLDVCTAVCSIAITPPFNVVPIFTGYTAALNPTSLGGTGLAIGVINYQVRNNASLLATSTAPPPPPGSLPIHALSAITIIKGTKFLVTGTEIVTTIAPCSTVGGQVALVFYNSPADVNEDCDVTYFPFEIIAQVDQDNFTQLFYGNNLVVNANENDIVSDALIGGSVISIIAGLAKVLSLAKAAVKADVALTRQIQETAEEDVDVEDEI